MSFQIKTLRRFIGGYSWPTLVIFAATWSLYIIAHALYFFNHIGMISLFLLTTLCVYLIFTPLHEASHGNLEGRSNPGLSTKALGYLSGLMFLAPFKAFTSVHLAHHRMTNDPTQDPDFWVAGKKPVQVLFKCLTIYPHYLVTYLKDKATPLNDKIPDIVMIGFYWAAVLGLSLFAPIQVLWGIILPLLVGTALQAFAFDWLPHHPHEDQHPMRNTRHFPGRILNILLLGQNVHHVHHLNPRIPFYRYRKASEQSGLDDFHKLK